MSAGCGRKSDVKSEPELRAALERDPADTEARVELAKLLMERGAAHPETVVTLQEGLQLDPGNAEILELLGETYVRWGAEAGNVKKYQTAERYFQQVVDAGAATKRILQWLGYAQEQSEQYEKAIDSFTVALSLDSNDPYPLKRLGYVYENAGKYEKALPVLRVAVKLSPDDYEIHWQLGHIQRLLGDYATAVVNLRKARELSPRARRGELDDSVRYTEGLMSTRRGWYAYNCHYKYGERHKKQGRSDRAIAEYKAALAVLPESGYSRAGWCYWRISMLYRDLNKLEMAVEHGLKAVEAYTKANSAKDLAFAYNGLENTYFMFAGREKGEERERYLEKALKALELQEYYARQAGNLHLATHALASKARIMVELYDIDDARVEKCRERMAEYLPERGPIADCAIGSVVHAEARLRLHEKDYDGAKELYEKVAVYYETSGGAENRMETSYVYNNLADISWKQQDIDGALMYGEKGVAKLTQMRSLLGVDEFRRSVGGRPWQELFAGTLVRGALEKGEKERAFNYVEQYKGRALLDLLGSKAAGAKSRTFERKRTQKGVVLARLDGLEQQVEEARSGGETENLRSLERTLSIEKTSYERLAEDVSVTELEVKSFEDVESLKVEHFRPMVEEFTLVSYVVGKWGTCATVLSEDGAEGVAMEGADEVCLRDHVEALRREIGVRSAIGRDLTLEVEEGKEVAPEEAETDVSEELYEMLIEPILPFIKTKLVYISPDSVLNYLPFEALKKDGRYLIEDYAIAYAPSGSVLKICMDRNRNRRETVLALGNPNLKNPAFRLVHAENEVKALEGMFPQVDVYTGDDATELVVAADGPDYDILHFACHGEPR
jgi:tetratricopeptide (TPR) repeat protein